MVKLHRLNRPIEIELKNMKHFFSGITALDLHIQAKDKHRHVDVKV